MGRRAHVSHNVDEPLAAKCGGRARKWERVPRHADGVSSRSLDLLRYRLDVVGTHMSWIAEDLERLTKPFSCSTVNSRVH